MKKALLTVILSIQVVIIASMPASSLVAASAIDDTVTKVAFKIDPRTFSGVKNDFHYHSNPAAGKLGCLGIRNIEGVLEVFNIEVDNTELRTIFERNTEGSALSGVVQTDDVFSISSLTQVGDSTFYYGQNLTTSGDAVQIASSKGIDLCRTVFVGHTPLVLQAKGTRSSPLIAMVVEPFTAGERPDSIFEKAGGALIDGVLDFAKPFGPFYCTGKAFQVGDDKYFMVAAKSLHFIVRGQQGN